MHSNNSFGSFMGSTGSPVAGVEASGALAMLLPVALAQPAELVAALAACHVHAALVLFDGPPALGALLGVRQDPVQVLALRAVLQNPLPHRVAVHLCKMHRQQRHLSTREPAHEGRALPYAESCSPADVKTKHHA